MRSTLIDCLYVGANMRWRREQPFNFSCCEHVGIAFCIFWCRIFVQELPLNEHLVHIDFFSEFSHLEWSCLNYILYRMYFYFLVIHLKLMHNNLFIFPLKTKNTPKFSSIVMWQNCKIPILCSPCLCPLHSYTDDSYSYG